MYGLPKKAILKARRELLELHKRCIVTYLTQKSVKYRTQKKFLRLYDYYISEKNIDNYFHRPIKLFVKALVLDRLDDIKDYFKL